MKGLYLYLYLYVLVAGLSDMLLYRLFSRKMTFLCPHPDGPRGPQHAFILREAVWCCMLYSCIAVYAVYAV